MQKKKTLARVIIKFESQKILKEKTFLKSNLR
jgi:hypothetical protein